MAKGEGSRGKAQDFLSDIFAPVRDELAAWELAYQDVLQSEEEIFSRLCNYVLSASGKRIRPALVILSAKAAAGRRLYPEDCRPLIKLAVSLELLHTATLIHDGIINDAELRRKRPAVNKLWGEEYSLLCGDYLFSKAFSLLSEITIPEVGARISSVWRLMCEGEARQLMLRHSSALTEEDYLKIIRAKTATLVSAACWLGAHLVEARETIKESLGSFGLNFGLALQIVDDCLDIMGKTEEEDKSPGHDLERGKFTLPIVYLLQFLPREDRKRIDNFLKGERKGLPRVKTLAFTYRAVELALKKAKTFSDKAKQEIGPLPKSESKESLIALADFILERLAA